MLSTPISEGVLGTEISTMKTQKSYNVQIWVGLKESINPLTPRYHTITDVRRVCDEHVMDGDCVSITQTEFRYTNGYEPGVIVGYIQYPRFPRTEMKITKRAILLAEKLMFEFNQYKVSVVTPETTYMLGNTTLPKREKTSYGN